MRITLTAPLVGAHFHPPATTLLSHLPAGSKLMLQAEPENPHDGDAIKVLLLNVALEELTPEAARQLDEALPGQGMTLEQVLSTGPAILGHVGASGGKPLAKLKAEIGLELVGTVEFKEALGAQSFAEELEGEAWDRFGFTCHLTFAPSGQALVVVSWDAA